MGQKKFSKEIRKYLEIMKMKIQQTIIYGTEWRQCQEGVYNCKRIDLKKKKSLEMNNMTLILKELEKQEQSKLQGTRSKEL